MVGADAERWMHARRLFEASLELPEGARLPWLGTKCGADADLLREVRSLLDADRDARITLEPPSLRSLIDAGAPAVGTRIGSYLLEQRIGSGGMGSVWSACRSDGEFEMRVAIKLVKRGMDTDEVLTRFRIERQVLARLDHPGIARLVDGGATADGLPYLVMEHVRGESVDRFCDGRDASLRDRLELFVSICDAVQHAHAHGIVHRDLKPGNILITAEGRPKLLDFGIAKILEPDRDGWPVEVTVKDQRLMTPEYASPEQLEGAAVTAATDVHGLGLVLFELLTGRRPFGTRTAGTPRVEDPPRPSTTVTRAVSAREVPTRTGDADPNSLAARRSATPRQLRSSLEGDLDAIVMRALRRDPARRYPDAGALRDDVERYLRGLPVRARPERFAYRSFKFVRRHRLGVAVAAAVFGALAIATAISTALYVDAERQRAVAEWNHYIARIGGALAALEAHDVVRARRDAAAAAGNGRGWELRQIIARCDRSERTCVPLDESLTGLAISSTARLALVGGEFGTLGLVALDSFEVQRSWTALGGIVRPAAISVDGRHAAVLVEDVAFVGFDLRDSSERWRWQTDGRLPRALAIDHGEAHAACGYRDGGVELRELETGRILAAWAAGGLDVQAIDFDPQGRYVATGTSDGVVAIFDTRLGTPVGPPTRFTEVWDLVFDPAGTEVAVALNDGRVARIDLGDRSVQHLEVARNLRVTSVSYSADGSELLAACFDRAIHVFTILGERPPRVLLGHTSAAEGAVHDPVRRQIVSIAQDRTLRTWRTGQDDVARLGARAGWYMGLAVAPDGDRVITSGGWPRLADPAIQAWSLTDATELWLERAHDVAVGCVSVDPTGRFVASGSEVGEWALWALDTGEPLLRVHGHDAPILDVAFAPGGSLLATASRDGTVALWDLHESGRAAGRLEGHRGPVSSVRFAPDGQRILTASWDRTAQVWRVADRAVQAEIVGHDDVVWQAVFDADGARIATASWDGTARVWRAVDGAALQVLRGHSGRVYSVAFSPDGTRIATGSDDRVVRLWDPARGDEVAALRGHGARVDDVVFTPAGDDLLSLSIDGELRRWTAPPVPDVR